MTYRLVQALQKQRQRERILIPIKTHARCRVALAHPNTYHVGMSNLGLQAVYRWLNMDPLFLCERFFLPPPEEQAIYRRSHTPLLTLETQRPVDTFDIVAFSVSFEFDYVWLLRLLRLVHLPPYAADRDERHPLVIVGGPCAWMNPLPIAPFVDVFALGDAEMLLPVLKEAWFGFRQKADRLAFLAKHPGFYVPGIHGTDPDTLRRNLRVAQFVRSTEDYVPPFSCVLTPDTEFGNTFLIEIMRGCVHWCRFCWIGYNHNLRFAPLQKVQEVVHTYAPQDATVGLIGGSPADHPEFIPMLRWLVETGRSVTVSSLRIDTLNEELLALLRRAGKRNITMAPETGSDRLRKIVRKPLTNDDLVRAVETIARYGFRSVKLYYIIGFPGETWEDLEMTVDILRRLSEVVDRMGGRLVVRPSFNCLIPKPGTPFQYVAMEPETVWQEKIRYLKRALKSTPYIRPTFMHPLYAYYQAILSLGGVEATLLVEAIERADGAWRAIVRHRLADFADLLFRERYTVTMPNAFISVGLRSDFLNREYEKARALTMPTPAPAS